jgi:membrane fusion protein, macrolide-specific efflux system
LNQIRTPMRQRSKRGPLRLLAAAAVLLTGCTLLPPEAEEAPIIVTAPVVTQRESVEIRRGDVEARLTFTVSFGSERQQALYFRTSGRVKNLHVRVGERVEQGELLAELESGSLPHDVFNAELDVQRKQLTLETAEAKKGFVDAPSPTDLIRYRLDVEQSLASLNQKREQLNNTRLHALFAGRIIAQHVGEGDQADAYREVMVIAAEGQPVARANVDDATAALLQVGQAAEIFPNDGDPTPVRAEVYSVPLAGTLRADRVVLLKPLEPSSRVQIGRNGRVEVVLERRENVLLVPLSAIRTFGGRHFVTVLRGDSRQEVAITIGVQGLAYAEVLDGLQEGDRVVSR